MHLCSGERVRCTSHAPACEWATSWSCRSDLARSALQLALGRRPFVTVMRSVCSPCRTSEQPAAELANQNNACGPLLAANSCTLPCLCVCRKNERPAAELANQKWGWIATVPGAWAELEVDTTTEVKVGCGCSHATVVSVVPVRVIPRRAPQAERGSRAFLIACAQLVPHLLPPFLRVTWRRRQTM